MMNTPPSTSTSSSNSSSTLTPQGATTAQAATIQTLDDLNHDTPVSWDTFRGNVRRCKGMLAPGLVVGLGFELAHVLAGIGEERRGRWGMILGREERWSGIVGVGILGVTIIVHISSLLRPIPNTTDGSTIKALSYHRQQITLSFFLLILAILLHTLPNVIYTLTTHHAPPSIHPYSFTTLSWARNLVLVYSLVVVGCTRRGPKLRFEPMKLATGFGVNADTAPNMDKAGSGEGDEERVGLLGKTIEEKDNVVDYQNSSLLSFILLFYMAPLLRTSMMTSKLTLADIPHFEASIRKNGQYTDIDPEASRGRGIKLMGEEGRAPVRRKVTGWMLIRSLFRGRGVTIFITLLIETAVTIFSFIGIISMHEIIESFDRPGDDRSYAYLMCWGLLVGQCSDCFLSGYSWVRENYLIHMPVRLSLSSMLFSKILRTTDAQALEAHNVSDEENLQGKGRSMVMNLLTIDVSTVASLATHVWNMTNAFVILIVGTVFMYRMFGISAFIGIACVPLSAPASIWVAKQIYRTDKNWARARDARTGAIKEFLLGYKVIKLNAFEPYLRRRIEHLRDIEIVWQRYRFTLGTLFNILADQLPALAIFVTFFFHTKVFHHRLDPSSAFVAWTVFNRVKGALQSIPSELNTLVVAKVAIERLVGYLNQEEIDLDDWHNQSGGIRFDDAVIGWPKGGNAEEGNEGGFKLKLDVSLPERKLTLVCGPLGSGKTLFLRALLGEATVESGRLMAPRSMPDSIPLNGTEIRQKWNTKSWLNDTVAYAPQAPYIRHGTIRDNILFGQPMWHSRYKEALRQASLVSDLALMPDGDHTEVGEHGVNLSGGQKARINLARCIYSRAKTVYMDDILSAVDAHTAQFIFNECLTGSLLRGRTVILVTHHVSLCLPGADYVISLKDGTIDQACLASDAKLDTLALPDPDNLPTSPLSPQAILSPFSPGLKDSYIDSDDYLDPQQSPQSRQIYTTEHSSTGRVAKSHYMLVFAAAGSLPYWLIFTLLYSSNEVFAVLKTVYLKTWSIDINPANINSNLAIYSLLISSGMIFGAARWFWLYGVGNRGFYNRGSRVIHGLLLDRVCNAPMGWFERTPAGRIMNIFGQDVWRLDSSSADDFARTLSSALHIVTSVVFVCFQAPALLVILVVFGSPLYWLSGVLIKLRADLRRLTATCGSPVITLYHDAIDGIVMIRAFGSCDLMMASMQALVNRERQTYSADWMVYNWVKGMIRAIASIFVTATGFALVRSNLSGAQAGLILSFAMSTSTGLFNLLEQYSNLEQTFVSAERINHYVKMDEAEPTTGQIPEPSWPASGSIKFRDLSVRYAPDLPEVLHKISFDVEPGMRVGLVGSTGSGKSTLALALFRAVDACEGAIEIDGRDISDVALPELRKRLNMVAQDGSLNSGTLREALDITGLKDDYEIYEALRRVHLLPEEITKEVVQDNPFANLDTFVAIEGANFSQGQRQLLCLARALLKHSKILVMDEATSSVDFEMDAKITATIRECFAGTTMIVIAHRLATIMQYDRVLVLDQGRVLEYASPLQLIEDENSAFHDLCMAAGEEEYEKLLVMARTG